MKNNYFLLVATISLFIGTTSSAQVVINEIYGGGGNAGATYKNDFIELYNNGNTAIDLSGWSVQYAAATGSTWQVTNLSGSVPAHGYYLIQEATGAGGTTDLPTPAVIGTIAMSGTAGKVLLCNITTAQSGTNPTGIQVVDKVGFGAANAYEGSGATPAPSNTTSVQRTPEGSDTDNNSTDFTVGAPSPSNGGIDVTAPVVSSLYPVNNFTNAAARFTATITFSENIQKGSGNIVLRKLSDNSVLQTIDVTNLAVAVVNKTASFPVQGLTANTAYYVEIGAGTFKDAANNSFAGISGSATWKFTTGTLLYTAVFNYCSSTVTEGFTQYSVTGPQLWGCTTFGRDSVNTPAGSAANGVQVNGFDVTNIPNEDWLISPSFDLTGTTYPLLTFWSRTAFTGSPLQLKVSTNYSGSGDPRAATWTDLNGRFPSQASDTWTISPGINLSSFKQAGVYVAFVYNSTTEEGARWTLDDISVDNSATPPPATLTTNTDEIQYIYVPAGGNAVKTFIATGNDISSDLVINSTANFLVSKDNITYSSSLNFTVAEANNVSKTLYVKFSPPASDQNYTGTIIVATSGITDTINLKGNSIDPAKTLEVVNWNLEWFGSTGFGPTNDNQQEQNVKTIMQNIGADIYGLVEIVDTARLGSVVRSMPGYSFVVSNFGSHTNPTVTGDGPLSDAQKLGFVYKTSMFSNISTTPLLNLQTNTAADAASVNYDNWSSGRYPFMMNADVTLNGITRNIKFIVIHAKANTSPIITSYNRRKGGADSLYKLLNTTYSTDNIIMLGDFNDDLDQTITAGIAPPTTSYISFVADSANYPSVTLPLSRIGKKSTVSYNDIIDHVVVSSEMRPYYMNSSANILSDVTSLVSNYASTTTDHYPVFSRYAFDPAILPVKLLEFTAIKKIAAVDLNWKTAQEVNSKEFTVERSKDGISFVPLGTIATSAGTSTVKSYSFSDQYPNLEETNYYRLKQTDLDGKATYSTTLSISFKVPVKNSFTIVPNPVRDNLQLNINSISIQHASILIHDLSGRVVSALSIDLAKGAQLIKMDEPNLKAGTYMVTVKLKSEKLIKKLVKL